MSKTKQPTQSKNPKNPKLRCKAYKFRLYPTKKQIATLEWTLRRCNELYNAALQERREAYPLCGVSVSYGMQADELPAIKQVREEYQNIHSQVLQDVLRRLDKAFDAFFRRLKNGEKPGYPRFKSGDRYDSFTYPQGGYEVIGNRLHLSKIGHVKIKRHRQIKGKIKSCTIKREGEQWYAVLRTEYELDPTGVFHPSEEAVGIDLGVKSFAVLSNGAQIANPRFYRQSEEQIQRGHRKLVDQYGTLVCEDLHSATMTKTPAPKQDEQGKYVPNGAAAKGGLSKSVAAVDASSRRTSVCVGIPARTAGRSWTVITTPRKISCIATRRRNRMGQEVPHTSHGGDVPLVGLCRSPLTFSHGVLHN